MRGALVAVGAAVVLVSLVGGASTPEAPHSSERARPLQNPDGTKPGLVAITSRTDRAAAIKLIRKVRVAPQGSTRGYTRARFGENWADTARGVPYARNGCRTRDDLLARDGEKVAYRAGSRCVVVSMKLHDPYTGKKITWRRRHADRVQVDHVVPLSYEWRMGAARWPKAKRVRIANDPLNLVPVSGRVNEDKGGAGPASWLPPRRKVRCSYVTRFAQVAVKYDLPVTRADKAVMLAQCR
ncbi:lipoprotein [Sphaerisporangium melleum]|uniref:Lipoprotein n=1 Tax=Sphaerisporangium melleum TaxID=321316 RepID=A0A917RE27_9ACTN|nr:HNH endonuclease family protein [Sphaerisporangium melleum]GGL04029.1 lipoprotein [Sphaerisporangium melleum]GII73989.1 lipoprotein [Sphaerisporangium melleum]